MMLCACVLGVAQASTLGVYILVSSGGEGGGDADQLMWVASARNLSVAMYVWCYKNVFTVTPSGTCGD